uniref:Zgc:194246 n=1 Tax=Paramormyrops kingsleyae TaxID=1676925 RepID=A0A3B3RV13_9TELE
GFRRTIISKDRQRQVQEMERLSNDLQNLLEKVENMSVQVMWMAYDMLVLRTNPETGQLLRKLEEEVLKCKAVMNSGCLQPLLHKCAHP